MVKMVKNKHAPPFRTAEFELEFGKGICRESEIIELGLKHKFLRKNGGFYYVNGETIHGKEALKQYLVSNESVREELMVKLREKLVGAEASKDTDPEGLDGDTVGEIVASDTTDEEVVTAVEG